VIGRANTRNLMRTHRNARKRSHLRRGEGTKSKRSGGRLGHRKPIAQRDQKKAKVKGSLYEFRKEKTHSILSRKGIGLDDAKRIAEEGNNCLGKREMALARKVPSGVIKQKGTRLNTRVEVTSWDQDVRGEITHSKSLPGKLGRVASRNG